MNNFLLPNGNFFIGCYLKRILCSYLKRDYSSILDVGCGGGEQLEFFKSRGFATLAGCDINVGGNLIQRDDIKTTIIDLDDENLTLPYEDDEFDVVMSNHVLEHLKYPEVVTREMVRVAKEIVLIVVPSGNSYESPDHINQWETFVDLANGVLDSDWTFSIELMISKLHDVILEQAGFIVCVYKNPIEGAEAVRMEANSVFPIVVYTEESKDGLL